MKCPEKKKRPQRRRTIFKYSFFRPHASWIIKFVNTWCICGHIVCLWTTFYAFGYLACVRNGICRRRSIQLNFNFKFWCNVIILVFTAHFTQPSYWASENFHKFQNRHSVWFYKSIPLWECVSKTKCIYANFFSPFNNTAYNLNSKYTPLWELWHSTLYSLVSFFWQCFESILRVVRFGILLLFSGIGKFIIYLHFT